MNLLPDDDSLLRAYLADTGERAPDRVLLDVAARIAQHPRRNWRLRGRSFMNTYAKVGLSAAAILTVAIAANSILPRNGSVPGGVPTVAPTATIFAHEPEPTIDLSAAVAHRMTPDQVQRVVLQQIAADEARAGQRLVTPRITLVKLMPAGASYSSPDGGAIGADAVSWLVLFEGTVVSCGSTCDAFTGGAVLIDDLTGDINAGAYTGHAGPCVPTGETCVIRP